jgi:Protein of unknown function (DUF2793)
VDKATTHNEALALLDVAISAAIDGFLVDTPPASPAVGSSYVVGASPTGAWAGHARALAGYTNGGWRFIEALEGLSALDKASGETATFRAGAWEKGQARAAKLSVGGNQVVGARGAAVADPDGGTIIDTEARAAVAAILARLRQHGLIAS